MKIYHPCFNNEYQSYGGHIDLVGTWMRLKIFLLNLESQPENTMLWHSSGIPHNYTYHVKALQSRHHFSRVSYWYVEEPNLLDLNDEGTDQTTMW